MSRHRSPVAPSAIFAATLVAMLFAAACGAGAAVPPTLSNGAAPASAGVAPPSVRPRTTSSAARPPEASPAAPAAAVSAGTSAVTSAGASAGPGTPLTVPSTSVIDWGEIWTALPPGYPAYPGSRPTVTGGGPASAILDVPAPGATASSWFQAALTSAGYAIVSASGPREDGTFDIIATKGPADCQTEISLAPLGATSTATIYFAAACPFN